MTIKQQGGIFGRNPVFNRLTAAIAKLGGGSVSAPSLSKDGDADTGLFFPSDNEFAMGAGGSEVIRGTATGIGINGATPRADLSASAFDINASDLSPITRRGGVFISDVSSTGTSPYGIFQFTRERDGGSGNGYSGGWAGTVIGSLGFRTFGGAVHFTQIKFDILISALAGTGTMNVRVTTPTQLDRAAAGSINPTYTIAAANAGTQSVDLAVTNTFNSAPNAAYAHWVLIGGGYAMAGPEDLITVAPLT
jgi:hypothetical protein